MILIATNSYDSSTFQPVVDELESRGEDVLVYLADKVTSGEIPMSLTLESDGQTTWTYGERQLSPQDISAAWFRRPNVFVPEAPDNVKLITLNRERIETQNSIWYSISPEKWLTPPARTYAYEYDKLEQLRIARKHGFIIPRTVLSNSWSQAFDSFKVSEVIMKLVNGTMFFDKTPHFLPTTILTKEHVDKLKGAVPFPGLWQAFIPKAREWRVTIVGSKVFAVVITATDREEASVDWRKYQLDDRIIHYKQEDLPQNIEKQCLKIMDDMNIRYGAFDFIEKADGEFVFLEVNLNGQYQWLEEKLAMGIPAAIADELVAIKNSNTVR